LREALFAQVFNDLSDSESMIHEWLMLLLLLRDSIRNGTVALLEALFAQIFDD